ncbi:MAG: sulfite exporter TauE/SafE family protein [Clostridia bacterium]|nr:sulfite exporter TauE/SafE family protein [Clostridia bacterium]
MEWLVSFALSVLTGMGVGGGGLYAVYLTLIDGVSAQSARGLNLVFFLFAATSALAVNMKRSIPDRKLVLILALSGIAGSYPGSLAARCLPPNVMRIFFGILLILSSVVIFLRKKKATQTGKAPLPQRFRNLYKRKTK